MKRHRLVCLKRLTEHAFDDSFSEPSSSNDENDENVIHNSPSNNPGRRNISHNLSNNFPCDICNRPHGNMAELIDHRSVHSSVPTGFPTSMSNDFASIQLSKYAFGGHISEYDLMSHEPCSDVLQFFQMSADLIRDLISSLSPAYVIQGRLVARARFFTIDNAGRRLDETFLYFPSHALSHVDGENWYDSHSRRIIELLDDVTRRSSNIEFDCIERVYVKFVLRDNVNGQGIFTLPPKLAKKRAAIINVDTVSECFNYALLSILHYDDVSNDKRKDINSYSQWLNEIDFGDIDKNNVSINDISKIERLNDIKINIHVSEPGKG
ncbi:MAG: hypothetical protein AAGJ80_08290, partial [Cyanobacteria bacterium J06553_1]